MTQPEGGRTDAKQNRERVLRAAREVLAERGVTAEMKEIADRAGVGVGTLYRNFATKDALVEAIIGEMASGLAVALDTAEAMEDPLEAMLFLLRAGWEIVEANGQLITALTQAGYDRRSAPDTVERRAVAILERGVAMGLIRNDVPTTFLTDYLSDSMPYVYWRVRQRWSEEESRRYCEVLIMSMLTGTAWTPPDPGERP